MTQKEQVINAMKKNGGYASFNQLNNILDYSTWKTKTPAASVRQIVQLNEDFFKIKPGLWGLLEMKDNVLEKIGLDVELKKPKALISEKDHAYYQGVIVEIGNNRGMLTYVPMQDKNKKYMEKKLCDVVSVEEIYPFTYEKLVRRAKTIDVIWFNRERKMPKVFYEIEHTTNISNSLDKFYELQDFNVDFKIVANDCRKNEFNDKINNSIYSAIKNRVKFVDYNKLCEQFNAEQIPRII